MRAVELLTDVKKLATQARRFRTKNKLKPTLGPPSRSSLSSRPGTPPGLSSAGSLTSPLLSPDRRSREEDRMEAQQSQALARNDSSGLGRRNMAGPFGTAAAQGDKHSAILLMLILFAKTKLQVLVALVMLCPLPHTASAWWIAKRPTLML